MLTKTFSDIADASSYLIFKLSAWKRDCLKSFEQKMSQTLATPFWIAPTTF